ncbi:FISUMP domain-containing protein [Fibrobacter sp.]
MKHLFSIGLIVALTQVFLACGDDDSGFIARGDGSSLEDDSGDSEGDEDSADSKSGSSSSRKGSSSGSNSCSSRGPLSSSSLYDVSKIEKGTFVDKRDGHEYRTVTIEGQTWMAQNLNYAPASSRGCHKGDNEDCTKYGRKYTWAEVIDSTKSFCGIGKMCSPPLQGICPDGWRIPAESEWKKLLDKLYGSSPTFNDWDGLAPYLFSKDNEYYEGIDAYGLSIAVPERNDQAALDFFTTDQWSSGRPDMIRFSYRDVDDYGPAKDTMSASLRCIKGDIIPDINNPEKTFGVRGEDRKVCNGVEMKSGVSYRICNKNGGNTCTIYEDGSVKIGNKYVYLEANGKKACPFEWHIPSASEWDSLFISIGGKCYAGYMLKAQEGWGDDYAFDALGLGIKPTDGDEARFLVGGLNKGEIKGSVVFKKGSNIATFKDDTANVSGLLCMKGRLEDDTLSFTNPKLEYGEFTDSRDNRTYKTINIGHTKWMAENLQFNTDSSVCFGGYHGTRTFSCVRYGKFYGYEDALTACPAGWRLPTKEELDTLVYIGAPYKSTYNLVSAENPKYKGNNASGFSFVTAGYQVWNGNFNTEMESGYIWSGTQYNDSVAYILDIYHGNGIGDTAYVAKQRFNSAVKINVRCVSEEKVVYGYKGTYGTLVDERDGHEYKTVEINGTTWMAENLKFESENSTCKRDSCDFYGLHYSFPFTSLVVTPLCPDGWHISTTADWDSLLAFARANDSAKYAYDLRYTFEWPSYYQGTDKYGLGIIPNTCYQDNTGYDLVNVRDEGVACIGAEDVENKKGYYYIMSSNGVNSVREGVYKRHIESDRYRYGIRCVKDK